MKVYTEEFDYEIIKDKSLNTRFSQTLVNEICPLFRTLWRAKNHKSLSMEVNFDPEWDMNNYGNRLADNLSANYKFAIDDYGNWNLSCVFKFIAVENIYEPWQPSDNDDTDFNIDLKWHGIGRWEPPTSNCITQVSIL